MKSNENSVVYNTEESAKELNKVKGFDPLKYTRNTENGAVLDLPYQKLWFRLKHPNGKIRLFIQKLSDKMAAVEARVFFDRQDNEPVANHIISGVDITDKNAVSQAQRSAMGKALSDAGFGLQFLSVNPPVIKSIEVPENNIVKMPNIAAKTVAKKPEPKVEPKSVIKEPTNKVETDTAPPITSTLKETTETVVSKTDTIEQPKQEITETKADPLISLVNNMETNAVTVNTQTGEVLEETPVVETIQETPADTVATPAEDIADKSSESEITAASYDKDTPVEEICKIMSLQDAMNYVIQGGPFNGWKMETLAKTRPIRTLETVIAKYPTKNNILTAAATIVKENMQKSA